MRLPPAEGTPLLQLLETERGTPSLFDSLVQLASILGALHAHGVSLGGVSPTQVVRQRTGRMGMQSWDGLATDEVRDDDWPYVPPEVAQRVARGPSADVFSLGVMLKQALAPGAEQHAPLDALVQRATAAQPTGRPADGWLFQVALQDALVDHTPSQATPDITLAPARAKGIRLRELRQKAQFAQSAGDFALVRRIQAEAESVWSELTGLAEAALMANPEDDRAHRILADAAFRKARVAEDQGDPEALETALAALKLHDRGKHKDFLRGEGLASIYTEPSGAAVELYQMMPQGTGLHAVRRGLPQRSPIERVRLPAGSWEARIERRGFASVVYPFFVRRMQEWDPTPPGHQQPDAFTLPIDGTLEPEEQYVPCGWTRLGGDPDAVGSGPTRRVWVEGFVMRRHPVTQAEFLEFVNELVKQRRFDDLERAQPKVRNDDGSWAPLYAKGFANSLDLPSRAAGMVLAPDQPVVCVDRAAAEAYALWFSVRTGHRWRLPTEVQWEKAARGADGRHFPWGGRFDARRCATIEAGRGRLPEVHDIAADRSPYGIEGLAGTVREWTSSAWTPAGLSIDSHGQPLPGTPANSPGIDLVVKGSSWLEDASLARCAGRARLASHERHTDLGFRLVRELLSSASSSVPYVGRRSAPQRRR